MNGPTGPRVLVVEADDIVAKLVLRCLTGEGYLADRVRDRDGILLRCRERRYDLVLASVHTMGDDPSALVAELSRAAVPLLLMTGGADEDILERAAMAGAHGPLPKPFTTAALLAAVRNVIG